MYHLIKKGKGFFPIDLYKGDIVDGKRHGFGLQLFANGSFYVGYWNENKANGRGKFVLPDNTYYEGIYADDVIQSGCVVYFNGTKFEGIFDATQYERFKNGTFTFSKGDKFKGEWKDGVVLCGRLFDREGKIWEFFNDDTIVRKYGGADNYGIIVSKSNKWFYEGGIEDNDCTGPGTIFCTFQQYKTGQFVKNQINGFYKKVGLNWGEIATGECEYDKRVGEWKRMLNKGILIETIVGDSQTKVSFPYINDDYFLGQLSFLNIEKKPYDFKYKTGVYYLKLYSGGYKQINLVNLASMWEIKEVKDRGVNFKFTFEKIFSADKIKTASIKNFITKLVDSGAIKLTNIHPFLIQHLFPEEANDFYSSATSKVDSKKNIPTMPRSKTPIDRKPNAIRNSKRGTLSPNIKKNSVLVSEMPISKIQSGNINKTEITSNNIQISQNIDVNTTENSPAKEASNLKRTIFKYESKIDKSELEKPDDIKETIVVKRENIDQSRIPDIMNSRMKFRSFINSKSPDISNSFTPVKLNNEQARDSRNTNIFTTKLFEKINSSEDEDDTITVESPLLSKSGYNAREKKKQIIHKDIKVLEDDDIDYFEGIVIKGKKQGFCKILYKNGSFQEGNFNEDLMEGPGYTVNEHLIEYSGNYVKGVLQGKGSLKLGSVTYTGEFKDGKFYNDCVQTMRNGTVIVAPSPKCFTDGFNNNFTFYFTNGYILEAELLNGRYLVNKKCKLSIPGQKSWVGKIVYKRNFKYFESITPPEVSYRLIDEFNEYALIL